MIARCLVAGCNGKFGAIFAEKMAGEGIALDGVDSGLAPSRPELFQQYAAADISRPTPAALKLLAAADCIVLCVPEAVVVDSIPILCGSVKPEAVLVDIASIKTRIEQAVRRTMPCAGYLSIHPMFGPLPGFDARNICLVPLLENAASLAFVGLLRKWNAHLTTLSAAEHDRAVAYVQSMTHAALLQIAGTLERSGLPFETMAALSTPVQRTLLALCARIVSSDPALYWDIQSANPFAAQARADYEKTRIALSETIAQSDEAAFNTLFGRIARYLDPAMPSLTALSDAVVEIAKEEG